MDRKNYIKDLYVKEINISETKNNENRIIFQIDKSQYVKKIPPRKNPTE